MSCRCSKNWTITNPKPISATAARTHAMSVRSSATRVRIHPKWLSEVIRQIAGHSASVLIKRLHGPLHRVAALPAG